ncbi:hypothetical protein B0H14DRAFT_3525706 [Mycena olivaceomarginata]|nr:hypothetical protein B0H14DRAFT_3525706 [Mycena olivaceomarginata]
MPTWILEERSAQAYSRGSSSLRSSFDLRFGTSVPFYTFTLASATRYAIEPGYNTTVEVRLFSSFPRPPPCHPTCPSSSSLPGNASCPFSSPSAIPFRRAYASILATTCCIRTALNSSYDLDLVHPPKYDFAASIASCDVGLPRQSMQATSSIGLPQQRSSGATRISSARRLRSAAHERVGSTRAFLVRGWGWEHTGSERKSRSENWSAGTSAAAAQHPRKSAAAAVQHERVVCEALEARTSSPDSTLTGAPKTTDTSSPRPPARGPQQRGKGSFGSAVLRGGGARQRTTQARTGWEREECVRAHKPRAPVMAGAHHLNLIRPAPSFSLHDDDACCAVHCDCHIAARVAMGSWYLPRIALSCSIPCGGKRFGYRVRPSSSPGSYVGFRVGVGPFLRGLGAPSPDPSAVCFPLVVLLPTSTYGPTLRLASCPPSPARLSPPPPPALVSCPPRPPPDLATRPRHWAIDFPLGNSDPALLLVPLLPDAAVRCSWCGVIGGEGEREEEQVWCLASALRRAMRSVRREHAGRGGGAGSTFRRRRERRESGAGEVQRAREWEERPLLRPSAAAKRVPIQMDERGIDISPVPACCFLPGAPRTWENWVVHPSREQSEGMMIASDEGTQMHEDESFRCARCTLHLLVIRHVLWLYTPAAIDVNGTTLPLLLLSSLTSSASPSILQPFIVIPPY